MPRRAFRVLRRLDRDRGVRRERAEHLELRVVWTTAAPRLADREDREHPAVGVLEGDEQLVLGMPRVGLVRRLDVGDVAFADVAGPIERSVRDEEGAAP